MSYQDDEEFNGSPFVGEEEDEDLEDLDSDVDLLDDDLGLDEEIDEDDLGLDDLGFKDSLTEEDGMY